MARIPKFAERLFAERVSLYDGVCHRVEEDERGWDYLVELPNAPHDGPADSQPPYNRAYVQVKSVTGMKTSVAITLSNMRMAAQDPSPWFIVLVKNVAGKPVLYIRHVWQELIEASLIAIRKAETTGAKLNKKRMSITFSSDDRIEGDFIQWIQKQIVDRGDYVLAKRTLYKGLGHENGYGKGRMLFTDHAEDEIFREFLGLGTGLNLAKFEYVPERFAIPDHSRSISHNDGKVYITPQPQGMCEARFRSSSPTEPPFSLTGTLYAVAFAPAAPVRVSAPPVELLFGPDNVNLQMSIRLGERLPLDHWNAYSRLKVWSLSGPLHVELWRDNKKIDASILVDRETGQTLDWVALRDLSQALKVIADDRQVADVSFSLEDVNRHIDDLGYLFQGAAPSMRFVCDADMPLEPGITCLLHYSIADLNQWTFGHIIRRRVVQDRVDDGRRSITAGRPEVLETYAITNADEDDRQMIANDYRRLLATLEGREQPLGFGELGSYVRELKALERLESKS